MNWARYSVHMWMLVLVWWRPANLKCDITLHTRQLSALNVRPTNIKAGHLVPKYYLDFKLNYNRQYDRLQHIIVKFHMVSCGLHSQSLTESVLSRSQWVHMCAVHLCDLCPTCMTYTPWRYLNQCWFLISNVHWLSSDSNLPSVTDNDF